MTALKKPLSVILAFVLVFALMSVAPIVAFAEDGEEIEYTVSEENVPEGYEVEGSPAENGGEITNNYHQIMAGVLLSIIPVFIVFAIFQKHMLSGFTKAAMK